MIGTTEPSSPTAWPLSVSYPGASAGGEASGSSSGDAGLVGLLPVMLTISFGDHVHGPARQRLVIGDTELLATGRCRELVRQAGRIAVLAEDKAAVAQRRGAGEDDGQRQRLAGQVEDAGPDMFAEQEHAEQARRQRVEDG